MGEYVCVIKGLPKKRGNIEIIKITEKLYKFIIAHIMSCLQPVLLCNIHRSNAISCRLIKFIYAFKGHVWRSLARKNPAITLNIDVDDLTYRLIFDVIKRFWHYWLLLGESASPWWIIIINGQKIFTFMFSSMLTASLRNLAAQKRL